MKPNIILLNFFMIAWSAEKYISTRRVNDPIYIYSPSMIVFSSYVKSIKIL